jgi:tetratricopeptide (TPR) repeat protein
MLMNNKTEFLTENAKIGLFALKYFLAAVLLYACFACSTHETELLRNVETIVEQQPDSAFRLLNTILFPEDMSESLFHKHTLLLLQAKDKSDRDITADTIIFDAKDYFDATKNFSDAAAAAFYSGRVLHEQGKTEKALSAYRDAEHLAEQTDDYNLQGLIQWNLSMLYYENLASDESIIRGKKAVELFIKAQNHKNEIYALVLIGNCFLLKPEIDSAFYYFNKSINLVNVYNISDFQSNTRQNVGAAFRQTKNYSIAKRYLTDLTNNLTDTLTFKADSAEKAPLITFSKVFTGENKLDSAKFYINKSLNLNLRDRELTDSIYLSLSEIEEKKGNYAKALQYLKQHAQYVINKVDNKSKTLLELNEKYDFQKLKTENTKLVIKQQQTAIILSGIILLIALIAFFFYIKWERNRKMFLDSKQKLKTLQMMADKYLKAANDEIETLKLEHLQTDSSFALKVVDILKITTLINRLFSSKNPKKEELIQKLNMFIYGQNSPDWTILYQAINEIKHGFYDIIYEKYPKLDEMEFRVCCLSCENYFDDTDIAFIVGFSKNMVQRKRSDARKKIGAKSRSNIHDFFIEKFKEEGIFIAQNTKKS